MSAEEGVRVKGTWVKILSLLVVLSMVGFLAVGCASDSETTEDTETTEEPMTDVKSAMVTDVGGLGDKSFNDLSYAGLQRAESELGVEIEVLESKEQTDYESNMEQLVSAGYSPIFAVGFLMTDALTGIAPTYPDVTFGGIDIFMDPTIENVVGLNFKEQETSYLAGVVAGMLTTMSDVDERLNDDKVVGFIGGMEVPAVVKFEAGYIAGAKSVDPDVEVLTTYVGSFTDQQKGKEAALAQIEQGADIIFAAAGGTGTGSFEACKESGALFIGVDADQYETLTDAGDTIITSAIKRVDNAVFQTVQNAVDGTAQGNENVLFGLAEEGVGLAPWHDWEGKIPQEVEDAVAAAEEEVIAGTVTVPEAPE